MCLRKKQTKQNSSVYNCYPHVDKGKMKVRKCHFESYFLGFCEHTLEFTANEDTVGILSLSDATN